MAIVINGSGTVTGLAVGGLPDGTVDSGTIATGTILPADMANGGNKVVQIVYVQDGALATGTTVLPYDDTIPQNTEGDEYLTLAITPSSATNKLNIQVELMLGASTGQWMTCALFQDTTAGALDANSYWHEDSGRITNLSLNYTMVAGTTSVTTLKVRIGLGAAGTTSLNGVNGARDLGGVSIASMTITEYEV